VAANSKCRHKEGRPGACLAWRNAETGLALLSIVQARGSMAASIASIILPKKKTDWPNCLRWTASFWLDGRGVCYTPRLFNVALGLPLQLIAGASGPFTVVARFESRLERQRSLHRKSDRNRCGVWDSSRVRR
jgi:hypothetical protein